MYFRGGTASNRRTIPSALKTSTLGSRIHATAKTRHVMIATFDRSATLLFTLGRADGDELES